MSHRPEDPARSAVSPAHMYVHTALQPSTSEAAGALGRLVTAHHPLTLPLTLQQGLCEHHLLAVRVAANPDSETGSSSLHEGSLKTRPLLAGTPAVKGTPRVKSQVIQRRKCQTGKVRTNSTSCREHPHPCSPPPPLAASTVSHHAPAHLS